MQEYCMIFPVNSSKGQSWIKACLARIMRSEKPCLQHARDQKKTQIHERPEARASRFLMYSYYSRQDYAIFGLISRSKSRVRIHSPSAKITLLRTCALREQLPTKDNLRSRTPEARAERIWWFSSFSTQKYVKLSLVRQLKPRVKIKLPLPSLLVSLGKNHPLRKHTSGAPPNQEQLTSASAGGMIYEKSEDSCLSQGERPHTQARMSIKTRIRINPPLAKSSSQ